MAGGVLPLAFQAILWQILCADDSTDFLLVLKLLFDYNVIITLNKINNNSLIFSSTSPYSSFPIHVKNHLFYSWACFESGSKPGPHFTFVKSFKRLI